MLKRLTTCIILILLLLWPASVGFANDTSFQASISSDNHNKGLMAKNIPISGLDQHQDSVNTLPMHQISDLSVKGSNNVSYYRQQNDSLTISATVKVDNDCNISPEQLKLDYVDFTECSNLSGCYFRCTYRGAEDMVYPSRQNLNLRLFSDAGLQVFSATSYFVVDYLPPKITLLKTGSDSVASNESLELTIGARDYAYTTTSINECSGLSLLELSPGNETIALNTLPGICYSEYVINKTPSELGLSEGTNLMCVTASDMFGFKSDKKCKTITVDSAGPVIEVQNMSVTDPNGNEIDYFYVGKIAKMNLIVSITDDNGSGIDIGSVKLNASELGESSEISASRCYGDKFCFNFNFLPENATLDETLPISASDISGNEAVNHYTLSYTFNQDTTNPVVHAIEIVDSNNTPYNTRWISGELHKGTAYVNITENETGISAENVYGDFSGLVNSGSGGSSFWQLINSGGDDLRQCDGCVSQNGVSVCYWKDVAIDLNRSAAYEVLIKLTDDAGNEINQSFNYNFNVDVTGPAVKSLSVRNSIGPTYIGSVNNTITLSFDETESGLDNTSVKIDLSGIGGSASAVPDSCDGNNSCSWHNIKASGTDGSSASIKISSAIKDNVGNQVTGNMSYSFTLDTAPPEILGSSFNVIDPILNISYNITGRVAVGDTLNITYYLKDTGGVSAGYADLSPIINATGNITATCNPALPDEPFYSNDNKTIVCNWMVGVLDKPGSQSVKFNFIDLQGLISSDSMTFDVVDISNKTNLVSLKLGSPSPDFIDAEVLSHFDPFIYFPLTVEGNANILRIEVLACFDPDSTGNSTSNTTSVDDSNYISSALGNVPEIIDYNTGQATPYHVILHFLMDRAVPNATEDNMAELNFDCIFRVHAMGSSGGKSVVSIEDENVSFTIPYRNAGNGDLDSKVKDEIDSVKDGWLVSMEWMDTLDTIFKYADMVCNLNMVFQKVMMIWAWLADGYNTCCVAGFAKCCSQKAKSGATKGQVQQAWTKKYETFLAKYCSYLSCTYQAEGHNKMSAEASGNQVFAPATSSTPAEPKPESHSSSTEYFEDWKGHQTKNQDLGKWPLSDPQMASYVSVKDNLFLSIYYICIPGVIKNLQRARVIECAYVQCLKNTKYGQPVTMCINQREYQWCKYIWGQLLNMLPIVAYVTAIGKTLQKALSSIPSLAGYSFDVACQLTCGGPSATGMCAACSYMGTLNIILEVLCHLGIGENCEPIWEGLEIDDSLCETALKDD